MAATMNKVFLMGNLTRDPDVRQTAGGEAVCELGLAVSEQYRSKTTNEVREVTTFVDVKVFGKSAENCGRYLAKGRSVLVEGRLVLDTWDDKATGQKRSKLRVRGDRVQFLSAGGNGSKIASQGEGVTPLPREGDTRASVARNDLYGRVPDGRPVCAEETYNEPLPF